MSKIDQQLFSSHEHALEKEYELCPKCGSELSVKNSKNGGFIGCNNYPSCDYTRPLVQHESIDTQVIDGSSCPECGNDLAVKSGRFGIFIGCTHYPECKHIEKHDQEEAGKEITCPICKQGHVEHRTSRFGKTFYGCSEYPDCDFVLWGKPIEEKCPECKSMLIKKFLKKGNTIDCSNKECKYSRVMTEAEEKHTHNQHN